MPKMRSEDHAAPPRRGRGLLALNAVLLGLLGLVTFSPGADAQGRARGDYIMIGGEAASLNGGVVYIVDTVNEEMIALTFDPNTKKVGGLGYRNLAADVSTLLSPGAPR